MTVAAEGSAQARGHDSSEPGADLLVDDLRLEFGGIKALDGISFRVPNGITCGLIGPNGAGKTTAFNVISRLYEPDSGTVRFGDLDLLTMPRHQIVRHGIARTFQNIALYEGLSVRDNLIVGMGSSHPIRWWGTVLGFGGMRRQKHSREHAAQLLDELGLSDLADRNATGLPIGTLKRIELARALAADPRLLLLDEPANGLTHGEVDELADLLRSITAARDITIVLVEHHMGLVTSLCDQLVVMDRGRKIAEGAPSEVTSNPLVIEAYLGKKNG